MSFQRALCSICERPTADGAVLAVHVGKEKLQTWFLNVGGHELAEEILDDDLICYFCLWHAEFLGKFNGISDADLVWWPRNSGYSDEAAKKLRNYYFEGKLEQCWVQLEKIELPQSDGEGTQNAEAEIQPRRCKCIYCGKTYKYSHHLSGHVKEMHKDAIRCSGGLSEMSHQKALCLICELPTADGALPAVHVDKSKLQTWFLNVSGQELAEEIEDDDLICYFCLWHAEFLWKFNGMSDEDLVWWNLDLDEAAKELRKHYFEGSIEQCWVPLEELDLPESEKEENEKVEVESESETQSNICPEKQKCLYCGSGALSEMSIQKALCLICELPTADGAVLAVHVDKEKLKTWFFNVCGHEFAEEIEDDDKICYFCTWQAEFQWKFDEMADENLVWWNLELDDAARELRKKYFEGKLEQCWVQLEKIELPKSADGEETRIVEVTDLALGGKEEDQEVAEGDGNI
ncbi:Hypothetical predicted protein [Cloeon dipterum]|uniref:C2H2-type domain-containing protein n=1 Tax=Cloeon dipterum TaxID=197152 RepID=A0A8S1DM95_9INSE|nr:Hypothetical predicted protein [Cloeon dipterum]